ncbi:ABC transporter ATP-binding protein [Streptomyces sp. NPDC018964]|uniref:ABC transporter ATP-binding protein n=1 Tax=unclassified Streptomyces TaxID=2593676 RepID=UPI0037AD69AE
MTHDVYASLPRFLARYRTRSTLAVLLITVNAAVALLPPFLAQRLIDAGALGGDLTRVYALGTALFLTGVVAAGIALCERWTVARLAEDITARIRGDLFSHLQNQSAAFFSGARAGAIVSRLHGDVEGVHDLVARTLRMAVSSLVTLVLTALALVVLDWRAALAAAALIPAVYAITARAGTVLRGIARTQLAATADLDSLAAERLSAGGAETVRLLGAGPREAERFRHAVTALRDTMVRGSLVDARMGAALTLLTTSATAAVYVAAGASIAGGGMTVGTVVALVGLLTALYGPLTALPACRLDVVKGMVSFDRISEIMCFAPAITDRPGARPVRGRRISFAGVAFAYPPRETTTPRSLRPASTYQGDAPAASCRPVLRHVTFTVEPGTTVGIVGSTGAGKSTLTRLLTRCWEPTAGRIEVGGDDIRDLALDGLRARMGVVTQDPVLFHGSLRDNLLMARPDASDRHLLSACATAQIRHLVDRLPDGLDTVLGDRGVRLSGGERQRLAIARMLLKEPDIVVLDEATSHLDNTTEHALHTALQPFLRDRTCLIIAHRLATVRHADLIVVLDDGRVAEQGTHEQLVLLEGLYSRLLSLAQDRGTAAYAPAPLSVQTQTPSPRTRHRP